jgi:hypothetical protein
LKFVSNFATNYLASWAMKGVVMRGVFAGYSAANAYFTSSTEGGDKEQIANAALDGGFFIERAAWRLYQGVANEGYKDPATGETNWKAVLTDTSMMFSMGGIPAGGGGKDATPSDIGNVARQVASEWKNPVETAKAEIGKIVETAKQFREKLKGQKNGTGVHEISAQSRQIAEDFYRKHNPGMPQWKIDSQIAGIDFTQPVEVVKLPGGTELIQYTKVNTEGVILRGEYYTDNPNCTPNELGISDKYNVKDVNKQPTNEVKTVTQETVTITKEAEGLKSTSAPIEDTWSLEGKSIPTEGGGSQIYIPKKSIFKIKFYV